METEKQIKEVLVIIAKKLHKIGIINSNDFSLFMEQIDSIKTKKAYSFACVFLNLSIKNKSIFQLVKNDFETLNNLTLSLLHNSVSKNYNRIKVVLRYLNRFDDFIFLDCYFEDLEKKFGFTSSRLKICIPLELKDDILNELYYLGAEIYENNASTMDRQDCDALVTIGGYQLDINCYSFDDKGISIKINSSDDSSKTSIISIPKDAFPICYKNYMGNLKIESYELSFIRCISSGKPADFVKAMELRNKINIKRKKQVEESISCYEIGVKEDAKWILKK